MISETATAVRLATEASPRLWPWLIAYVVDWHNSTIGSAGSSAVDSNISPHQRFTLRQPRVMDLAAFGSRAVVLKPTTHQHKPSLSARGWVVGTCFVEVAQDVGVVVILPCNGSAIGVHGDELVGVLG